MKIGIFGDSYANVLWGTESGAWWRLLENMGHEVTNYGESSSSIAWSALRIDTFAADHDFNIWCTTAANRVSSRLSDGRSWYHISSTVLGARTTRGDEHDYEKSQKLLAYEQYMRHLHESDHELFTIKCIINTVRQTHKNLMIIPGFRLDNEVFCLNDVSLMEELTLYPEYNDRRGHFHKDYKETRVCHMSRANNKILAQLINQNLQPGVFQASVNDFVPPTHEDKLFTRK